MSIIRILSLLVICISLLSSCKINQRKNGEKTGRWIYKDQVSDEVIISRGRYKHDFEKGTWKEYNDKKLLSKKRYKDGMCYTTEYHFNGKKKAEGISELEKDGKNLHWYLSGEWKFYDEQGKYIASKFHEKTITDSETKKK